MSSLVALLLIAVLAQAQGAPAASAADGASSTASAPNAGTTIKETRPDKPLRIRVKLAKGTIVAGLLATWDDDAFSGDFGRIEWTELTPSELKRLFDKVMDDRDASHQLRFAELLVAVGLDAPGETAWKKAVSIDPTFKSRVAGSREAAKAMRKARLEKERMEREGAVQDFAEDGAAPRWPVLTDAERDAAL